MKLQEKIWSSNLIFIWSLASFFFATMSLLVQLVALPYFFPALHAGNGLLVGGDWVGFNAIASELAERISSEGWSVWELRPERQAPAGIAAVFYVFLGPYPWSLIAINAVVQASIVLVLTRIMQIFIPDIRFALVCVLPFIFFPTSLIWYSQIHKDGTFFLGATLNLYGWILLSRVEAWTRGGLKSFLPALYILVGCFLVWVMRPYGVKLMQGIGCIFVVILIPYFFFNVMRRKLLFKQALLAVIVIAVLPMAIGILNQWGTDGGVMIVNDEMLNTRIPSVNDVNLTASEQDLLKKNNSFAVKAQNVSFELKWIKTEWLPRSLDNIFLTLAIIRVGYASTLGGSDIDSIIHFRSVSEFFYYMPRAIQIGFTAPFLSSWSVEVINSSGEMLKKIVLVEMLLVYPALLFLIYALFHWCNKIETWLIFIFCTIFILLYTYITPNIGSLHRTRYGFLMTLTALGIAGGIALWQNRLVGMQGKTRPS